MASPIHDTSTFLLGGTTPIRRLGYGAMQLTGDGVWGAPADRDGAIAVLRAAVEMGVNFIDTADSYGPDVSETLIGEALAPYANDVVIATKAGLVRPGPGDWRPNGRPEHIRMACEGSLERLRLERIPLYQLHRIDPDVPVVESIGTMLELRDEGKIDMIGVSEVNLDELREVQELCEVAAVQNRFNVGDREWSDVVDACAEQNIAFIPWFPLGSDDLGDAVDVLDAVADSHRATRHSVALAWLLHRSPTMVPIPGTKTMSHLEDNVSAGHLVDAITDDEWATLDGLAVQPRQRGDATATPTWPGSRWLSRLPTQRFLEKARGMRRHRG